MSHIVIDAVGIKRTVPLPCGVCLSREQAYQIRDAMNTFLGGDATYGWTTIHRDKVETTPNSAPIPWSAGVLEPR